AISKFVKLRLQQGVAGEGDIVALENLMRYLQAEDALYWSGVAQFENGDFRTAGNTLKNYLDRYTEGRWVQPARELLAESLAEQDRMDEAKAALKLDQWTGPARLRQLKRLETWQQ
ncbi:tetratricopeptide repeat protein, partial [bacterium]|nr:tetratricopeptide repeat protein [bacterium]